MDLSKRQKEALQIIKDHPGIYARGFGELFWPDHLAHKKQSNNSYGSQRGKPGWLMAGSYLGKLKKKGLIRNGYKLAGEKVYGFYLKGNTEKFL